MLRKTGIVIVAIFLFFGVLAWGQLSGGAAAVAAADRTIKVSPPTGAVPDGAALPWVSEELSRAADIAIDGPHGRLYGGPYVTDVTTVSAVLHWVLRGSTAGNQAQGWRVLHSEITGLRAGVTYYYDVQRDGTTDGNGQFCTPPSGSSDFTFVVYGDTRTREDVHRQVAAKVAERSPAFVVHTGDLVADGTNAAQWPGFFEAAKDLLRKAALFPALGNHERNSPLYGQFFPAPASYYSFDWGGVHIAVLNSDIGNVGKTSEEHQKYWRDELAWLDHDLAGAAKADYRFVVLHHPPYSAVARRQGSAERVGELLIPILKKDNVQAVFSGHDHNYQHHVAGGIHYIVTGGGGAPLYDVAAPIPGITQKAESVENFVLVHVTNTECRFEAIALDGHPIDTVAIPAAAKKAPGALPAAKQ